MTKRRALMSKPSTATVARSAKRPSPSTTRTPRPLKRSRESCGATAAMTSRTWARTAAKSTPKRRLLTPKRAPLRNALARSAAASSAFDGSEPLLRSLAAHLGFFDQHHIDAEGRGRGRRREAARAGADDADSGLICCRCRCHFCRFGPAAKSPKTCHTYSHSHCGNWQCGPRRARICRASIRPKSRQIAGIAGSHVDETGGLAYKPRQSRRSGPQQAAQRDLPVKRTYQPSKLVRKRRHGFRAPHGDQRRPKGFGAARAGRKAERLAWRALVLGARVFVPRHLEVDPKWSSPKSPVHPWNG